MSERVVECLGLEKVFTDFWGRPRVRALQPLTLDVPRGEVLGLLGPNGAGKSTAIKLLLGLLRPTRGEARLFGGSPQSPAVRARVGYLPEETRLFKFLDATETLDLFGKLHGLPRAERRRRGQQLIEMVGLEHAAAGRAVGEFSKGMARRIGLAVALAGDPDLLILDEPTSGLDPLGTREIKDLILELRRRGRTIVLSSHLLDDVEDVADRIAILYGGKLRRLGRTRELLAIGSRVRVELDRPADFDAARLEDDLRAIVPAAGRVEVTTPQDRLEALFRRVVLEAQAGHEETAGARAGGPIAAFLGGGPHAEGPPRPEAPHPEPRLPRGEPAPAPPPARETPPSVVEALLRPRAPARTSEAVPVTPAPATALAPALQALLRPAVERAALPAPAAATQPGGGPPSAAATSPVLQALLRPAVEPLPPPATPAPPLTPPPRAQDDVLARLLGARP